LNHRADGDSSRDALNTSDTCDDPLGLKILEGCDGMGETVDVKAFDLVSVSLCAAVTQRTVALLSEFGNDDVIKSLGTYDLSSVKEFIHREMDCIQLVLVLYVIAERTHSLLPVIILNA